MTTINRPVGCRVSRPRHTTTPTNTKFIIVTSLTLLLKVCGCDGFTLFHSDNQDLRARSRCASCSRVAVVCNAEQPPPQQSSPSSSSSSSSKKPSGVYARPSAAIERGSGFYVPGLEGPKVRLAGGLVLFAFSLLNSSLGLIRNTETSTNTVTTPDIAQGLALFYSLLVLLQAAIEYVKEQRILSGSGGFSGNKLGSAVSSNKSYLQLQQAWTTATTTSVCDPDSRDRVEWVASSYLSLTRATHMMLIQDQQVVYFAAAPNTKPVMLIQAAGGEDDDDGVSISNERRGIISLACRAALDTLKQSSSGRVALPQTHPTCALIEEAAYRRTIILQRVNPTCCWVVASNDLLAAFTKQDLQMLGQLAIYLVI